MNYCLVCLASVAEATREATAGAVQATAETLAATLENMQVVEDMRRTLRDIKHLHKLPQN